MKFFIKTFGCQMNVNDSEKMRHILEHKGLVAAENDEDADLVVLNSCAVREKAQEKIFSYIGRLPREKRVIVAGCVAQSEREQILKGNKKVDFVVGTHQYYWIDDVLDDILKEDKRGVKAEFSRQWKDITPGLEARDSKVTGFISIMEGCDNFCSYCIVPFTRGREKHRPFAKIMEEAQLLADNGYQEIILLGQNVNNWQDPELGMLFPDLLARMGSQIDVRWIRFITSYPGYFDRELIAVMKEHRRIARHIHFPAQAGSTRVLKLMNRRYTRSQYLEMIGKFKRHIPDIQFSSDFIVGFPGETDHDFRLTLSLLEKVEYESIFSFIYSPRKHTKALAMNDSLSLVQKKERLYELQELQRDIQLKNNQKLVGQTVEVLVTGKNPKAPAEMVGRTETYRVVNFVSDTPEGTFAKVKVERVGPYSLRGIEIK
jgi:tRNA-2-methylthio-N6-dimethylallyladenosine synthase